MLDLWFGLDASGFDKASTLRYSFSLHGLVLTVERSTIPSDIWSSFDSHLRLFEQHTAPYCSRFGRLKF
jgi:hypothetical protein